MPATLMPMLTSSADQRNTGAASTVDVLVSVLIIGKVEEWTYREDRMNS